MMEREAERGHCYARKKSNLGKFKESELFPLPFSSLEGLLIEAQRPKEEWQYSVRRSPLNTSRFFLKCLLDSMLKCFSSQIYYWKVLDVVFRPIVINQDRGDIDNDDPFPEYFV
jgi:hypothetical protein